MAGPNSDSRVGIEAATGKPPSDRSQVFKNLSALVVTTEQTVWTPAAGKRIRLMGALLSQGVATGAITVKAGVGGSTILVIPQHTLGVALPISLPGKGILLAADVVLTFIGVSTETVTGFIYGNEE